ncbi:MAG: hypothetical protein HW403_998, partial [Dehalococcoidia bacterium]|nr:hypothetical protein [Dehalococcoidia bacterium]
NFLIEKLFPRQATVASSKEVAIALNRG